MATGLRAGDGAATSYGVAGAGRRAGARMGDALLAAIAEASRLLLEAESLWTVLPDALELLGRAAGWSRTQLLLAGADADGRPGHAVRAEWVAEGIVPQLGHATHGFIADAAVPSLAGLLRAGCALWLTRDDMPPDALAVFAYIDVQTTVSVPVFVGGEYAGLVAFDDCAQQRPRTDHEMDALQTAARVIGAALQRDRLVDAVTRERARAAEARASELRRANAALRAGLDRLAGERDPRALLRQVLGAVAEALDARSAALFTYSPATERLVMTLSVSPDLAGDPDSAAETPFEADADVTPYWRTLLDRRGPLVLDARDAAQAHLFWPGTRDWHLVNDQPMAIGVPLLLGDEPLGFVAMTLSGPREVTAEELGLVQALAHQATLALHVTRLAEETRAAAVERERAHAAEERAAELAAAGSALRRVVSGLAETPELRRFLPRVLAEMAGHAGAASALLFTYDAASDSLAMSAAVVDGEALDVARDPRVSRLCTPFASGGEDLRERIVAGRTELLDLEEPATPMRAAARELHAALRHRFVLRVPLFLAARPLGFVGVCFRGDEPPSARKVEVLKVLATQAALALELSRLADEGRHVAVAEERNRIARELHDTIAQGLAGIVMQLGAARVKLGAAWTSARSLDIVEQLARENLAAARRAITLLRPGAAEDPGGLEPALLRLVREARAAAGAAAGAGAARDVGEGAPVVPTLDVVGTARRLPLEAEFELTRVVQAALANALVHAGARRIVVSLDYGEREADGVRLSVLDDGVGFDPSRIRPERFGLVGMRERAARIGAALTLVTAPGEGTEVVVMWPGERP